MRGKKNVSEEMKRSESIDDRATKMEKDETLALKKWRRGLMKDEVRDEVCHHLAYTVEPYR